jgi:hypothetical protein
MRLLFYQEYCMAVLGNSQKRCTKVGALSNEMSPEDVWIDETGSQMMLI